MTYPVTVDLLVRRCARKGPRHSGLRNHRAIVWSSEHQAERKLGYYLRRASNIDQKKIDGAK